jgi:hypothetical protein
MKMFAILDKAKPDIENIKGLNLVVVRHATVSSDQTIFAAEATRNMA